jgi:hypothetical protein
MRAASVFPPSTRATSVRLPKVRDVAATLSLLALAACGQEIRDAINVGIAPESSARHLVFTLAPSPLMYGLSVLPCGGSDRPMWEIAHDTGTSPVRIVYGELPAGYVLRSPAQPLRPGCYRVLVSGPSSAEFMVNADGTVSSRARP